MQENKRGLLALCRTYKSVYLALEELVMGNLREQLLKIKLIDESQSRQVKREKRQKRKERGIKTLERESKEKTRQFQNQIAVEAAQNRELAHRRSKNQQQTNVEDQISQMIETTQIISGLNGSCKFYFIAQLGIIPCLEVSSAIADLFCNGDVVIVEKPGGPPEKFVVVPKKTASKLQQDANNLLRFFNH
ncbi:DUF2058 domain-containing protein [bacterium]|nr:DUF2058 domain-containing protein [bacterium]